MKILKQFASGDEVRRWQAFLLGCKLQVQVTGVFDAMTKAATEQFQRQHDLEPDGVVGRKTLATAIQLGLPFTEDDDSGAYPARPAFDYPNARAVRDMFGEFKYAVKADGTINIIDRWAAENIVKIKIPQLIGVEAAPADGMIYFHRKGAEQLKSLFAAWEAAGLLHYVRTWGGSFVPRMQRGSRTALSNHAFGSAFDINAAWNGLGRTPADFGDPGTVLPLVKLANEHGFYWGGHYRTRPDGMHFELARLNQFPARSLPAAAAVINRVKIQTPATVGTVPPSVSLPVQATAPVNDASPTADAAVSTESFVGDSPTSLSNEAGQPTPEPSAVSTASTLNVEDYKPFVKRWLWRVWAAITGGNVTQGFALFRAGVDDSANWYIYAAVAAVILLITIVGGLLVSVVLGVILWKNRDEISRYITLSHESHVDPGVGNINLEFEKK